MLPTNVYQLFIIFILAAAYKSQPTVSQNELVTFLKDGFNKSVAPCDNFYDFVCGNHSSSSANLLLSSFFEKLLKLVRQDTKYPSVSKALLDYFDDCVQFVDDDTYKLQTIGRYLENILNHKVAGKEMPNFFESLLKLILPVPARIDYGVFSPTELITIFDSKKNVFYIFSDPNHIYVSVEDFDEQLVNAWKDYLLLTRQFNKAKLPSSFLKEHNEEETKLDESILRKNFLAFVEKFRTIVATSNESSIIAKPLRNITNKLLQEAIFNTIPYYIDDQVNIHDLNVALDEDMLDKLHQLFLSYPLEGKQFFMCIAISMVSFSIDIMPDTRNKVESFLGKQETCLYDALDPKTSGTIFNLYAANLLVRNQFPMTSVNEQLAVRNITESIRSQIRNSFMFTSWLQNDREMLRNIDTLLSISKTIGLPDEVYNDTRFSSEFKRFAGFKSDDDMIQKIIRLRTSNRRLIGAPRKLGASGSYFEFNAFFDVEANKLQLFHSILLPPFYSKDYPASYNYGILGSTIGHEFLHRFSPPDSPSDWKKHAAFKKSVDCYENFYNGLCYNLTQKNESGVMEVVKVCADGHNDIEENVPDVEGARVAFQAMKSAIGEKELKERAMPEFDFTNEQMFFISHAQFYCDKLTNDHEYFSARLRDKDDTHGAQRVRVNAVSMQMEEFRTAFSCKSTDPMVIESERMCYLFPRI